MRLGNRKLANPFICQGYESPEYFCDREVETATLLSHLKNGRNVTLISPRRIGKTGLIKNTFFYLQEEENYTVCLTELMFTDNDELSGLIARMLNAGIKVIIANGNVPNILIDLKEHPMETLHTEFAPRPMEK